MDVFGTIPWKSYYTSTNTFLVSYICFMKSLFDNLNKFRIYHVHLSYNSMSFLFCFAVGDFKLIKYSVLFGHFSQIFDIEMWMLFFVAVDSNSEQWAHIRFSILFYIYYTMPITENMIFIGLYSQRSYQYTILWNE